MSRQFDTHTRCISHLHLYIMIGIKNEKYTWSPKHQSIHIVLAQSTWITENLTWLLFHEWSSSLPACLLVQILTGLQLLTSSHGYCCFLITRRLVVSGQNHVAIFFTTSIIGAEGIIDSLNSLDVQNRNLVHCV